ncbi:Asp/Glu racemase [Gluconacetobacter tumulisoli]|uniref:Asp/Glu racemase n=2 Tax=Gluconacetobacter tumulisoli TaxID=1286189 RepID=A0A7W4PLC1_9PROT|nr:Asp/Glu racemase [Gluconacetobacter tumulisoli]
MQASPADPPLDLGVMDSTLDGGLTARAALGVVVLATDQTLEHEFRFLLDGSVFPGVAFYVARVFNDADITPATLQAIGARLTAGTALILPGSPLDVVAFGCTSATMVLGEDAVFAELRKARPGVACTTPITGALAAFQALGARRIGLLTPYRPDINRGIAAYFAGRGVHVAATATFDRVDDRDAARIQVADIEDAAARMAQSGAIDALFVSCTSLRVAEAVDRIERRTGLPVTSSNHAMAWHMLRLAGITDPAPGAGRLFRL